MIGHDIAYKVEALEMKSDKIRSLVFALYMALYECDSADPAEFIGAYDVLEDFVIDLNRELALLTKQAFEALRSDAPVSSSALAEKE